MLSVYPGLLGKQQKSHIESLFNPGHGLIGIKIFTVIISKSGNFCNFYSQNFK